MKIPLDAIEMNQEMPIITCQMLDCPATQEMEFPDAEYGCHGDGNEGVLYI